MKTLVIYDSYFGNTRKVAEAIAQELGASSISVNDLNKDSLKDYELLILGSPTRGFRPAPPVTAWFKTLKKDSLKGIKAAVFDTRIVPEDIDNKVLGVMVKLFGYAAEPMAKELKNKGAEVVGTAEGFAVNGKEGPLKDGELERARAWAKELVS